MTPLATALREARRLDARDRATRFVALCQAYGLPAPDAEVRFHPVRKWRWDYAWPAQRLALEVDGGIWVQGRHARGSGIVKDHAKQAEAACHGWRVIRVAPSALSSIQTINYIRRALEVAR